MRKLIPFCIAALLLWGCSASSPSVTAANSSDSTPVTGQKVLFQVVSVSDNPPMTYTWQCDSGDLEPALDDLGNPIGYYEYWTAPEATGPTTVTCTITDDRDETRTQVFNIDVKPRELASIKDENGEDYLVSSIEKQRDTSIAGLWFSTEDGEIRYITSAADQLSTWTGTFGTMHIGYDNDDLYTLWGAPPLLGNEITVQTSTSTSTLTSTEFGPSNKINDLTICADVYGTSALLFGVEGTDPGIYYYYSSSEPWGKLKSDKTYSFFTGEIYTYAATSAGVYKLLSSDAPICTNDSCAVLEVEVDDTTTPDVIETDIWHVTKDGGGDWKVWKNGAELPTQPAEVAGNLDVDLKGDIWCGKYYWDGTAWGTPSDPDGLLVGETIKTVIASTEGRIYFLTQSGTLFRW